MYCTAYDHRLRIHSSKATALIFPMPESHTSYVTHYFLLSTMPSLFNQRKIPQAKVALAKILSQPHILKTSRKRSCTSADLSGVTYNMLKLLSPKCYLAYRQTDRQSIFQVPDTVLDLWKCSCLVAIPSKRRENSFTTPSYLSKAHHPTRNHCKKS